MDKSQFVRLAVPVAVILPLVWLMVGCVYLPWFEQANLNGAKRDFRNLSGKSPADPIADGRITKEQIIGLLGPPVAQSANGRVIAYTMTTRHGVWIEPLCLNVTPGGKHLYAVGLRFDGHGVLEHHCFVEEDIQPDIGPFSSYSMGGRTVPYPTQFGRDALAQIDRDNGVVRVSPLQREREPGNMPVRGDYSLLGSRDFPPWEMTPFPTTRSKP